MDSNETKVSLGKQKDIYAFISKQFYIKIVGCYKWLEICVKLERRKYDFITKSFL